MTIGTSLFLLAVGAILKYAVEDSVDGVNLGTDRRDPDDRRRRRPDPLALLHDHVARARERGAVVERERVREREPRL